MLFTLVTPLTTDIIGLGRSLPETARVSAVALSAVVMVMTMMGHRIRRTSGSDDDREEDEPCPCCIPGIHTGIAGLNNCGIGSPFVDARGDRSALFGIRRPMPA